MCVGLRWSDANWWWKMPRGGRRTGTPGTAYTNRTDLQANQQPVQAKSGQEYGKRQAQERAQHVVPLPAQPQPVALDAPTARPNEPLTAGIPMGAGAGPEALATSAGLSPDDELAATIKGLARAYPNSDLMRLAASLDMR